MTGTERKRIWRLHNPERRRAAERARAQARREGYWLGRAPWAEEPRPCASSKSYRQYELGIPRTMQRLLYPRHGAGAHRLSPEQFRESCVAKIADIERSVSA